MSIKDFSASVLTHLFSFCEFEELLSCRTVSKAFNHCAEYGYQRSDCSKTRDKLGTASQVLIRVWSAPATYSFDKRFYYINVDIRGSTTFQKVERCLNNVMTRHFPKRFNPETVYLLMGFNYTEGTNNRVFGKIDSHALIAPELCAAVTELSQRVRSAEEFMERRKLLLAGKSSAPAGDGSPKA